MLALLTIYIQDYLKSKKFKELYGQIKKWVIFG